MSEHDTGDGEHGRLGGHSDEYREWIEAGSPEPTAAEPYYDGKLCEYPRCDNLAEWLVEVEHTTTFRCCDNCGETNRIYPADLTGSGITIRGQE